MILLQPYEQTSSYIEATDVKALEQDEEVGTQLSPFDAWWVYDR